MSPGYQILPGLPADGPMAVPFRANEWSGAWSGHSEGLVVRFNPDTPETWVANFQPGSGSGGWEGVLEHPNGKHLVVLARGQGYVVDPVTRQCMEVFSGFILDVVELPDLGAILVSDGIRFEAIKSDGIWWSSPRISWDEIRNIKFEGTILRGEASSPARGDSSWVPFTLDLMTGQCEDGVYESDMQRAIPIRKPLC
jgi:hypothetical protein